MTVLWKYQIIKQSYRLEGQLQFQNTKCQKLYIKSYVVGLDETILMSTHNIGFGRQLMGLERYHSVKSGHLIK